MRPRIGITSAPTVYDRRRIDRVNRWYVEAVARAGGLPLVLPNLPAGWAGDMLAGLDGVVLPGGGDVSPWLYGEEPAPEVYGVDAARDAWEAAVIREASHGDLPLLAICRGCQLLNVVAGGSLIQHLPDAAGENHRQRERNREPVHTIEVIPDSRLAQILGLPRAGVNSIHHQAIDRIGAGLRAVAWAPDGVIEAVERTDGAPVVGVQWHPEALVDLLPHGRLFLWLTQAAARRRPGLEVPDRLAPPMDDTGSLAQVVEDVA